MNKHKIGDLIYTHSPRDFEDFHKDLVVAIITDIVNNYYYYKFLKHPIVDTVNTTMKFKCNVIDSKWKLFAR